MKKYKVVIVCGNFPPDAGGPATYIPKLADELSKKDHDVQVVCLSDKRTSEDEFSFDVHRILRNQFIITRIIKTVFKILKISKSADIILVNTLYFEPFLANIFLRKTIVHKIVGDYAWERARNQGLYKKTIDDYQADNKSIRLRFFDIYRTLPLKFADCVFAPSEYLRKIIIGWGVKKSKTAVVYNAVNNPKMKRNGNANTTTKIITVCRLVSWKGLIELIEVAQELENVELHIVGDGPEESSLKKLSNDLNAESKIFFRGRLAKPEVEKELASADIFVLNSSYEGLPHVILEAMLAKLPVICNDVGGCKEVVHHLETGFLMDKNNPNRDLATGLNLFLSKPDLADNLAAKAYTNISEKFSMDIMVNQTLALFDRVTNSKPT